MRATIVCAIACAMLALQAEAALTTGRVNLGFFYLGRDLHPSLPFYRYNPRWSLALVLPVTKYTTITEYKFTGELLLLCFSGGGADQKRY